MVFYATLTNISLYMTHASIFAKGSRADAGGEDNINEIQGELSVCKFTEERTSIYINSAGCFESLCNTF